MMKLNYQYRWQQLASRLMDDLVRHPIATLPGIHALGRQYKVSKITVELALKSLEDLGVIAPAQRGKRRRIKQANLRKITGQQLRAEHALRETLKQQQDHLNAELHRARLESLELAHHHIGQSVAVIEMRLSVLKMIANTDEQLAQIELSRKDLHLVMDILHKLRTVTPSSNMPTH